MFRLTVYDKRIRIGLEYFKTKEEAMKYSKNVENENFQFAIDELNDFEVYKEWCKMQGIKPNYASSLAEFKQESGLWNACN